MCKSEREYHRLRRIAKSVEDKSNTILYVNDISPYIKNEIKKRVVTDINDTNFNIRYGYIKEEEGKEDIEMFEIILKSL